MEHSHAKTSHYFLRAIILLGFAMLIVYLVKTDSLIFYIAPHMQKYVEYSSVLLYVIAIYQVYLGINSIWGKKSASSCGCEHPPSKSSIKNTIAYSLFILPLCLGFLLPSTAMSSSLADKKGMNLTTSVAAKNITKQLAASTVSLDNSVQQTTTSTLSLPTPIPTIEPSPVKESNLSESEPSVTKNQTTQSKTTATTAPSDEQLQKMFKAPDEFSEDFSKMGMILYKRDLITVKPEIYMEVLSTIDLFKENFIGKKIELTGFVYREKELKTNQIIVGRFAVSCCSADASPYGVLTEFPTANNFAKDSWVKVTGTIEKGNYNDNDIFKIHATKVEKIPSPKSPYVYPNFDPIPELNKSE